MDGSLYAKVRKKSASDTGIPSSPQGMPATSSPDHGDHTLSVSSDSGHSTASARTDKTEERLTPGARRGLSPQEKAELDQLLGVLQGFACLSFSTGLDYAYTRLHLFCFKG